MRFYGSGGSGGVTFFLGGTMPPPPKKWKKNENTLDLLEFCHQRKKYTRSFDFFIIYAHPNKKSWIRRCFTVLIKFIYKVLSNS
jgi:hypothetical protein